jgi:Ca2+-binding RTX toxin-like protein
MSGTDPHDTSAGKSGGTDSFSGAAGNDSFYMGANLTAAEQIDGGANTDTVYLDGDYSGGLVFNATTMVNVEFLNLAAGNSYDLTLAGETAAAGQTFTIQAGQLGGGDTLTIDGSAVAGNLVINAGSGDAVLTGGSGNDVFRSYGGTDTISGGGGNDVINLRGTFTAADHIDGGTGIDTLYLNGNYSAGVTFDAATLTNVEVIALADSGSYSLTIDNATVAAGDTLTLQGRSLTVGHNVVFDGSADTTGGNLIINSGGGNDVLTGGNGNDIFRPGSGTDTIHGGGGDDVVNMGAFLTAADKIDGGSGVNTVYLDGDYSGGVTFNATTMVNIESIRLAAGHSYSLTMDNATVAAGQTLFANASTLSGGDHFDFDGSADTSGGSFNITGGAGNDSLIGGWAADVLNAGSGNDTLQGGGGADTLVGGPGADHFVYNQVSDSTGLAHDRVTDFDASADFFKFTGDTVTAIDAAVNGGKLTEGNFDGLLAKYVGAGQLGAHHAVLFTPDAGVYHDHVFLIVDANGVAGYQAGQDYVIDITGATNLNDLTTGNFTH